MPVRFLTWTPPPRPPEHSFLTPFRHGSRKNNLGLRDRSPHPRRRHRHRPYHPSPLHEVRATDGLGGFLRCPLRLTRERTDHPLNEERFNGASVLLAGVNFGWWLIPFTSSLLASPRIFRIRHPAQPSRGVSCPAFRPTPAPRGSKVHPSPRASSAAGPANRKA